MRALRHIFSGSPLNDKPLLFAVDLVQVLLLFYLVQTLQVEAGSGYPMITWFVVGGFIASNLVNKQYSVHVFILVALALVYYAFSWFSGTVFLVIFSGFFVLLSARLNMYLKITGFIMLLLVLAFLRMGYVYKPRLYMVTPFIGMIFMFRGISYLYYVKNHGLKGSFVQRLAYFMMFPSLVFSLFPIVNFKEFLTTYLVRPYDNTRQKAIRYLLRGLTHLLLYRILLAYVFIDESGVSDLPTLLQYVFSAYFLILRLSGILHTGMALICLFGYDLSPVFHYYFLGNSFADLWRRINTYWRNFMQTVFFYPLYFRTKKKLGNFALPFSTTVMFLGTWFFHNYQLFWASGNLHFTVTDAVFWMTLGLCITLNVTYLDYKARNRIRSKAVGARLYVKNTFFITGCLVYMALLWSVWNSIGFSNWAHTMSFATVYTGRQVLLVSCIVIVVFMLVLAGHFIYYRTQVKKLFMMDAGSTRAFTFTVLCLASSAVFYADKKKLPGKFTAVVFDRVSAVQTGKQERGYYKQMMDVNQAGAWEVSLFKPLPNSDMSPVAEPTTDLYLRRLKPSVSIEWKGKHISTNSFGIRDREYTVKKPEGTLRIAMLGGSYESGSGVSNSEVFEALLENELNATGITGDAGKVEILNFACGGYHLIQQVKLMHEKVPQYGPDIVFLFAHSNDSERLSGFMADLIQSGINLEYPYLRQLKQRSGVKQYLSEMEIRERLRPYMHALIGWAYRQIAAACKASGIKPVWVFLPATRDKNYEEGRDRCRQLAVNAGFEQLDLSDVYITMGINSSNVDAYVNSATDPHPNAKGHAVIARYLFRVISENKTIFNLKH